MKNTSPPEVDERQNCRIGAGWLAQVEQRKALWQRQHRAVVPNFLPENSFLARLTKREHKVGGQMKGFGASGGLVPCPSALVLLLLWQT